MNLPRGSIYGIGALICVLGACITIYFLLQKHSEQSTADSSANQPDRQSKTITIPFDKFVDGKWDNRGPTLEMQAGRPTSLWMANVGQITYSFTAPEPLPQGDVISVLLSSELMPAQEKIDDPTLTSDVSLLVNDEEPQNSSRNVVKDTGENSSRYTWHIPTSILVPRANTLTLQVKANAQHAHGITIFSPITIEFPDAASFEGTVPVNNPWTFIGNFRGKIRVVITGQAVLWPDAGPTGPEGLNKPAPPSYPLPGANVFCALAMYNGQIEKIGAQKELFFKSETGLYLGPNEERSAKTGLGFADNSGAWSYKIIPVK